MGPGGALWLSRWRVNCHTCSLSQQPPPLAAAWGEGGHSPRTQVTDPPTGRRPEDRDLARGGCSRFFAGCHRHWPDTRHLTFSPTVPLAPPYGGKQTRCACPHDWVWPEPCTEPGPREASWWVGGGLAAGGGGKLLWYLEQPGLPPFLGTLAAALGGMKGVRRPGGGKDSILSRR